MAKHTKYTVYTRIADEFDIYPKRSFETINLTEAKNTAEFYVNNYPNELVYISFYRYTDGQEGFINRNGVLNTGIPWN